MIKVEKHYNLDVSIEKAFGFLSDPEHDPLWQKAVVDANRSEPGDVYEGMPYTITFKFLGKEMEFDAQTCAYDPPKAFAYESTSGPFGYAGSYELVEDGDQTSVTFCVEIEPKGFFGIIPEMLLQKSFETQLDKDIARLQERITAHFETAQA